MIAANGNYLSERERVDVCERDGSMAERNDLIKSVCVDAEALFRIQIRSKGRLVSSNRCPMTPFVKSPTSRLN
jgi:hypothetical protein